MNSTPSVRRHPRIRRSTEGRFVGASLILLTIWVISTPAFWGYRLLSFNLLQGFFVLLLSTLLIPNLLHKLSFETSYMRIMFYALLLFSWIMFSSRFNPSHFLRYLPCLLLLATPNVHKYDIVFTLLFYASVVFAVGTVLQMVYPSIIDSIVLPQFRDFAQHDRLAEQAYHDTYRAGFTYQSAINAGFLLYGFGYIVISASVHSTKRWRKLFLGTILLFCMAATYKRAHFGFSLCALTLVYYSSGQGTTKLRKVVLIITVCVLSLLSLRYILPLINIGSIQRLNETLQQIQRGEDVLGIRSMLQLRALDLFRENPLLGIGWKEFRSTTFTHAGHALDTHNIYLQLLCETGIVGFLLFVSFFIYSLVKALQLSRLQTSPHMKTMILFALYIQLFFLLYGYTGNPLYDFHYYMPYLFACAYVHSLHRVMTARNRNHPYGRLRSTGVSTTYGYPPNNKQPYR